MMENPKHWKAYLNHLDKLKKQHKMMIDVRELEIRLDWKKKTFGEKFIDRILFRSSVPDSLSFNYMLEKLNIRNYPDVEPRLEGYWTWLVNKKISQSKDDYEENAFNSLLENLDVIKEERSDKE